MKLVRYNEDDGISPALLRLAKDRALLHLNNIRMVDHNLEQLVVNCYLQGAYDMALAVVHKERLENKET